MSVETGQIDLEKEWLDLANRLEICNVDVIFQALVAAYSEPWRKYHTLTHIADGLRKIDEVLDTNDIDLHPDNVDQLKIAWWFHDGFYVIGGTSNEVLSGAWAYNILTKKSNHPCGTHSSVSADAVRTMIEASKEHMVYDYSSYDEELLFDIDMSILGAIQWRYKIYAKHVEEEYTAVYTKEEYTRGRRAFLESLANRTIFSTSYFADKYENQAKDNIKWELSTL